MRWFGTIIVVLGILAARLPMAVDAKSPGKAAASTNGPTATATKKVIVRRLVFFRPNLAS